MEQFAITKANKRNKLSQNYKLHERFDSDGQAAKNYTTTTARWLLASAAFEICLHKWCLYVDIHVGCCMTIREARKEKPRPANGSNAPEMLKVKFHRIRDEEMTANNAQRATSKQRK